MINPPQTPQEARKYPYRNVFGGSVYRIDDCAWEVTEQFSDGNVTYIDIHQCTRKNGHGIGGLYCKQHAKIVDKMKDNIKQDSIEYWNDD